MMTGPAEDLDLCYTLNDENMSAAVKKKLVVCGGNGFLGRTSPQRTQETQVSAHLALLIPLRIPDM